VTKLLTNFPNLTFLEIQMREIEEKIKPMLTKIEEIVDINQAKVLNAFQKYKVADFYLHSSTGYGYNDIGREVLEQIYAEVFGHEKALVRPHFVSGTHAIAVSLFGLLRPGDQIISITGSPYDTLEEVIGIRGSGQGSLIEYGISYKMIDLINGMFDFNEIKNTLENNLDNKTRLIYIQRSRGYSLRPALSINDIKEVVSFVKKIDNKVIILVDNCYGEFVEINEPTNVGADVIVGSLIKNPGGGIAKTGGYIVGQAELINKISYRLTAPGIGNEVGAMLGQTRDFYQGLFLAPHVVGEALKGAIFISASLELLGFNTTPKWNEKRFDIIQSIIFNNKDQLITFLQGIQKGSPIDSHVLPEPNKMPGYNDQVIMAAGTFVQGASIELSGDAPIREPYAAFIQGGLTYSHVKYAFFTALNYMIENKSLNLRDKIIM